MVFLYQQLPVRRYHNKRQVFVTCSLSLTFIIDRSTGLAVTWILYVDGMVSYHCSWFQRPFAEETKELTLKSSDFVR